MQAGTQIPPTTEQNADTQKIEPPSMLPSSSLLNVPPAVAGDVAMCSAQPGGFGGNRRRLLQRQGQGLVGSQGRHQAVVDTIYTMHAAVIDDLVRRPPLNNNGRKSWKLIVGDVMANAVLYRDHSGP